MLGRLNPSQTGFCRSLFLWGLKQVDFCLNHRFAVPFELEFFINQMTNVLGDLGAECFGGLHFLQQFGAENIVDTVGFNLAQVFKHGVDGLMELAVGLVDL